MRNSIYLFVFLFCLLQLKAQDVTIWGTTPYGGVVNGTIGSGVIFQYNPLTNQYKRHYVFQIDDVNDGSMPNGLCHVNGKLYGITESGGAFSDFIFEEGYGTLFEFDIATKTYTKLYDFNGDNGVVPRGSLTEYNGKLYGITLDCGLNSSPNCQAVLFAWDIASKQIQTVHEFTNLSGTNFINPNLTLYQGKLYGTTTEGNYNNGSIFVYDLTSHVFQEKYHFNQANGDGHLPNGGLVVYEGKIYGTTSQSKNGAGVIFEWNPNTNQFKKHVEFSGLQGASPFCGLTLINNKFYGVTYNGGAEGMGTLFEWDPNIPSTHQVLYHFKEPESIEGTSPMGQLIVARGKLYGLSNGGGTNDFGTLFEYNPDANTYTKKVNLNGSGGASPEQNQLIVIDQGVNELSESSKKSFELFPNPFSSSLLVKSETTISKIEIFDLNGKSIQLCLYSSSAPQIELTLSELKNGVYFIQITNSLGEMNTQKIVKW